MLVLTYRDEMRETNKKESRIKKFYIKNFYIKKLNEN